MALEDNSDKLRNEEGQFISQKQTKDVTSEDLPKLVHKSTKMSGALKDLQEEKEKAELDKPLVAVSVNNPISWFMKWLKDLKKRQTTTFTFKMGVPLVALPIIIVVLLSFILVMSSRTTKKEEPTASVTPTPTLGSVYIMSKSGTLKIVKGTKEVDYFIVLPGGEAIRLELPKELKIDAFENKKIFVSGKYEAVTATLYVEKFSDMEPSPTTTALPTPTPTPLPTETPTPVSSAS